MVKQSKTQISLIVTLGLMILGQVGFGLYKGHFHLNTLGSARAISLAVPKEKHFQVSSVKELDHVFKNWNYSLTKAKSDGKVPRLFLAKLPRDMQRQAKSSNASFIQVLLPHILKVNEKILEDRARLQEMQKRQKAGHHLRHSEKMWLSKLASDYRCKSTRIEALLKHVDIVPPSLALAQATIETGGGRSHAAVNKNSTFGHMRTKKDVQKFASLEANVLAYITNLNRHAAYKGFREIRAGLRARNKQLCGHILAAGLHAFSERGHAYIRDVQNLIDRRDLRRYDHMRLKL
ncbi:MAG TPA: glucosaminidase domain-containing protein [Alphaproteobacteria bacterium]|nr:glucosaminidase domain-containing protein [Alphaproteobacteria bacterium]